MRVYFRTTAAGSADWKTTSLARAAAEIPGARLIADPNGENASRFQVRTSGHVLYYGPDGHLLFSGGITAARGHGGENPGKTCLLELLAGRHPRVPLHAVYGCPIFDPGAPLAEDSKCPVQK